MNKPIIAITMGDPAGIGPELAIKVLTQAVTYEQCRPVVIGDVAVLKAAIDLVDVNWTIQPITDLGVAEFRPGQIDLFTPDGLTVGPVSVGQVDAAMGRAAAVCLSTAYELAMAGQVQGVVSAPLNKEAFHLAGYDYFDEVAYLADITGSAEPFILGVMEPLWVVTVTEHVPFRDIADLLTEDRVLRHIHHMQTVLTGIGRSEPRIGVAALNPHGGEGGLFGREEIDVIRPAIMEAQEEGIDAVGPIPADAIFVSGLAGAYDGVVCMYHDQANIARKLQPMEQRVTLFMGLPVVCGTTAHGTAFDIAGQGIADPGSLASALRYAAMLASS